jgi:KUP system potassium uptake protein
LRAQESRKGSVQRFFLVIGLFGASLLYGDGMITPAISVLSAVEGIRIIAPGLGSYVVPLTVAILTGLFLLQHRGTARVGALFGPVILLWFLVIATLGVVQIARHPHILRAISPWHGVDFVLRNRAHGFLVLGAVFLVVTGSEALYADMGHFGRRPIRLTWVSVVFPALLFNYYGQGALLLANPQKADHLFYALVPSWAMVPVAILATLATIIASQAVITGSFSLTKQAIQLGYLPRLQVTHTLAAQAGQIYVSPVNWLLMVCTIGLVLGFQSSSKLAAAYGVAVTSTMLISTVLFYQVAHRRWGWNRLTAGFPTFVFLLMDSSFFGANVSKILHGAWFPLVIGGIVFVVMTTWRRGREILAGQMRDLTPTFDEFKASLEASPPQRVRGQAIFLTGNPDNVPAALLHNLAHNKVLHSEVAFLHFVIEDVPRVPNNLKVEAEKLGSGFYRITARYGFMEEPKIQNVLSLAREKGLELREDELSYFVGQERLLFGDRPKMNRWAARLFRILSRNALDAAEFFNIPSDQVIEVGVQVRL